MLKGLMIGVLAGGAVGALVALLYAPKSGRELRADIKEKADGLMEGAEEYLHRRQIQRRARSSADAKKALRTAHHGRETQGGLASRGCGQDHLRRPHEGSSPCPGGRPPEERCQGGHRCLQGKRRTPQVLNRACTSQTGDPCGNSSRHCLDHCTPLSFRSLHLSHRRSASRQGYSQQRGKGPQRDDFPRTCRSSRTWSTSPRGSRA